MAENFQIVGQRHSPDPNQLSCPGTDDRRSNGSSFDHHDFDHTGGLAGGNGPVAAIKINADNFQARAISCPGLRFGQPHLGKFGIGIGRPGNVVLFALAGRPKSIERITTPA